MAWTTATTRATGFLVTAAVWNSEHVDNMNFLKEVGSATFTSDYTTTATTEATATQIATLGAIVYENVPHLIEFSASAISHSGTGVIFRVGLFDGATIVGNLLRLTGTEGKPCYRAHRFTPTAASHTYNVRGWVGSGTGTIIAGNGGADTALPGLLRICRIPT